MFNSVVINEISQVNAGCSDTRKPHTWRKSHLIIASECISQVPIRYTLSYGEPPREANAMFSPTDFHILVITWALQFVCQLTVFLVPIRSCLQINNIEHNWHATFILTKYVSKKQCWQKVNPKSSIISCKTGLVLITSLKR